MECYRRERINRCILEAPLIACHDLYRRHIAATSRYWRHYSVDATSFQVQSRYLVILSGKAWAKQILPDGTSKDGMGMTDPNLQQTKVLWTWHAAFGTLQLGTSGFARYLSRLTFTQEKATECLDTPPHMESHVICRATSGSTPRMSPTVRLGLFINRTLCGLIGHYYSTWFDICLKR